MVAMNVWPTDAADGSVASEVRWRKMARYWANTGVLAGQGGDMAPTLAFPNLTVKAGACWVDGHFCELPGDQVLAVTANGLAVVRFDPAANTAQLLYLDGVSVPAQNPNGTYELPIAQIVGSALVDRRPAYSRPWNMPWGRMAMQRGQGQLSTSGGVELILMTSPAFACPKDRWLKITCDLTGTGSVATDVMRFGIRRGATTADAPVVIGPGWQPTIAGGYLTPFTIVAYDAVPAANNALRYSLGVTRTSGTGIFTIVTAGTYDNGITIEDLGPVAGTTPI